MKKLYSVFIIVSTFLFLFIGCQKQVVKLVPTIKIEAESYVDSFV